MKMDEWRSFKCNLLTCRKMAAVLQMEGAQSETGYFGEGGRGGKLRKKAGRGRGKKSKQTHI